MPGHQCRGGGYAATMVRTALTEQERARGIALGAALRRCGTPLDSGAPLTQFLQVGGEWLPTSTEVEVTERPPMRELLGDPLR